LDAVVGYSGGRTANPTYKDVCTDETGHAEVVQVTYDPAQLSYEQLLNAFWEMHDPTQVNRQGPDFGKQYRSAIFFHSPEQEAAAKKSKAALGAGGRFHRPLATEITAASPFYRAEEYHQALSRKARRRLLPFLISVRVLRPLLSGSSCASGPGTVRPSGFHGA